MWLQKLFVLIICAAIGYHFIVYSRFYLKTFGRNSWAEGKFGPGGTLTMWKIFGIVVMIIGLLYLTGDATSLVRGIVQLFI